MKIYTSMMLCSPMPDHPKHGQMFQATVVFYCYCKSESEFERKRDDFLESEKWKLIQIEMFGETTESDLQEKPEVLQSLSEHGDFAIALAKHGSDN